jgi:hypothetical protein
MVVPFWLRITEAPLTRLVGVADPVTVKSAPPAGLIDTPPKAKLKKVGLVTNPGFCTTFMPPERTLYSLQSPVASSCPFV